MLISLDLVHVFNVLVVTTVQWGLWTLLAILVRLGNTVLMEQDFPLNISAHLEPIPMLHTYSQQRIVLPALLGITVLVKNLLFHLVYAVPASTVHWALQSLPPSMNLRMEALVHQAFTAQKGHLCHSHVMEAIFVQKDFSLLLKGNAVLDTFALERQRLVNRLMASQETFVSKDTIVLKVVLPLHLVLLEHTVMQWVTRM